MRSQTLQLPPLRSVLKSGDVEDPVNRYVHRTLAYLFVKAIFRTRITPNMITLSTVIIGFSAGCAFIWGTPTAMFAGGVGIWVAAILDGADGILARAKNLHSEFGRALDGSADSIVAVFTVFPGFYHIWVTYHNPYHLALMVRPAKGAEGRDADEIGEIVEASLDKGPIVRIAVEHILVPHLKRQRAFLSWLDPKAWQLSKQLKADEQTADIYRNFNQGPMRLWALVSSAPHTYLMAICAMFDRLDIYLLIRVFVMNGIFLVAAIWQRHATSKTVEELAGVRAAKLSSAARPLTT
jgi:hypothetical protein